MQTAQFFVGLDIAADDFTVAVGTSPWHIRFPPEVFVNTLDGFQRLCAWLRERGVHPANSILCMEATGVYGEALAYFLAAQGFTLAVEPPLKVRRAFHPAGSKSDPVDSQQVAEYAYRFLDELKPWQPPAERVEQIRVLLTTRQQFIEQMTGHQNILRALERKPVRTPLAEQVHRQSLAELKQHVRTIDAEIKRLIHDDPTWHRIVTLLLTIPGVGLQLAACLLVLTQGFTQTTESRTLAAHIGICPYEHRSGKSVYRPSTSRHFGPSTMRKLLYLAALSVRTHNAQFEKYFLRKVAEGKPKRLVINNIENKLLRVICGVLKSEMPFIPNYRSVNPMLLKAA